jgi:hypothetical protein
MSYLCYSSGTKMIKLTLKYSSPILGAAQPSDAQYQVDVDEYVNAINRGAINTSTIIHADVPRVEADPDHHVHISAQGENLENLVRDLSNFPSYPSLELRLIEGALSHPGEKELLEEQLRAIYGGIEMNLTVLQPVGAGSCKGG